MNIRPATLADVPVIAELGERFHAEAGWPEIAAPYVRDDCAQTLRKMVEGDDGFLLVADDAGHIVGMAGGVAHPFYFNFGHLHGAEVFWWVEAGRRDGVGAALFDALEEAARAIGCKSFSMSCVERLKPELMARLYRRRGFEPSERSFIKRLEA